MEIYPIEGYKVCKVPVTIGKSYKVEVLCIVDDIDECHILLGRPWRCEVNGKYDVKRNLYLSHGKEGELLCYKQHDDKISTLLFQITNKVDTLKTSEEIMGFSDDEDVKGFNCELKTDFEHVHNLNVRDLDYGLILRMIIKNQVKFSMADKEAIFITTENLKVVDKEHITRCFGSWIDHWEYGRRVKKYEGFRVDVKRKFNEDKVRREVFEVDEALAIENSRVISFQLRGNHVDETKVNAVRDWSSPKILSEVRNNKVADVFQKEDELEYFEPLDKEAEQVTYVVKRIFCSPKVSDSSQRNKIFHTKCLIKEKIYSIIIGGGSCENLVSKALVKDFKLPTEPRPSPYQIGWIKKGPTLKVTEICKVLLAIGKHYNELVTCDVVDKEECHVLLERPWQHDVDSTHQQRKTLVTLVASPKQFQAERKEKRVSYALVVKGVEDFMENAIPAVVKPLLVEIASLPNLPHYRMSPNKSEVLLEKIEELLKTCHIQESISPCAVPALHTPKKDGSWRMEKLKLWNVSLAQAEFAYNSAVHSSTGFLSFEVVYKTSPRHVVDFADLSGKNNVQANRMVEEAQATHEVVRANITEANAKYKITADKHRRKKLFQVGDEVMVFRRKKRFPVGTYSKLQPKINDNDYLVDLPNTMSISKTFNVLGIYEFHSVDVNEGKHSRTSSFKERRNDDDMI
ncbi:hypothetical protein Tco_0596595 [Tanacetum coccineum]